MNEQMPSVSTSQCGVSYDVTLMASVCILALTFTRTDIATADPGKLTQTINQRIADRLAKEQFEPAPSVDDATFLRRVSLDLLGRTPTVQEILKFQEEPTAEKRRHLVDRLLASSEHAEHFARVWRGLLIPESDTDRQVRYFVPGFEAWLRDRRHERTGFDQIVRELITVPITGTKERPQLVLTDLKTANPIAFYACKNASAADLAASTIRLFLGVRLECAQCHDHPFDSWTQQQFWNQAAFFAGIERKGQGAFAPILEDCSQTTIPLMDKDETVSAIFLDGGVPVIKESDSPRVALANWIVSPENDLFAQAIANRIWGEFLGIGLVDPVDDFYARNPPSHPELLNELGSAFRESKFDLDVLYRSICLSDVYQRSSTRAMDSDLQSRLYAYRVIKPMTGEQFYDSLAQMLAMNAPQGIIERTNNGTRRRVVDMFATHGNQRDPETAVVQVLELMNGRLANDAIGSLVTKLLADDLSTDQQRLDHLYLRAMNRFPTPEEREVCLTYLAAESNSPRDRRWRDILWALLNSAESRWNY